MKNCLTFLVLLIVAFCFSSEAFGQKPIAELSVTASPQSLLMPLAKSSNSTAEIIVDSVYYNFENGLPNNSIAFVGAVGNNISDAHWGPATNNASSGTGSVWCAASGGREPGGQYYPNNMDSWLRMGPFDFSNASTGVLSFDAWMDKEGGDYDPFYVAVSVNGVTYALDGYGGRGDAEWHKYEYNLRDFPELGNIMGESSVYFALVFRSDNSGNDWGVYVDNFLLQTSFVEEASISNSIPISPYASAIAAAGSDFWYAVNNVAYHMPSLTSATFPDSIIDLGWNGNSLHASCADSIIYRIGDDYSITNGGGGIAFDGDALNTSHSVATFSPDIGMIEVDGHILKIAGSYYLIPLVTNITGIMYHNNSIWVASDGYLFQLMLPDSGTTTAMNDDASTQKIAPSQYSLDQNYPNPFNPTTTISFFLPQPGQTELFVYNSLGQKVRTLINEPMDAGDHSVTLDARNLSSGIYFYRIKSGQYISHKRMTLLK